MKRVEDDVVAALCRDEEGADHKYHTIQMRLARDLRAARAEIAMMSGASPRPIDDDASPPPMGFAEATLATEDRFFVERIKKRDPYYVGLGSNRTTVIWTKALERLIELASSTRPWLPIASAPKNGDLVLLAVNVAAADQEAEWVVHSGWFETALPDRCWYNDHNERIKPSFWMEMNAIIAGPPRKAKIESVA